MSKYKLEFSLGLNGDCKKIIEIIDLMDDYNFSKKECEFCFGLIKKDKYSVRITDLYNEWKEEYIDEKYKILELKEQEEEDENEL